MAELEASVVVHPDAGSFLDRAAPFLERSPAEHNVILGIAGAIHRDEVTFEEPLFLATVEVDGVVAGAAMRTPPHKLIVTDLPGGSASAVADAVAVAFEDLPAVLGPEPAARAVADAWAERTGVSVLPGMRQRIYRLDRVSPPEGVEGSLRPATEADLPLVHEWATGFARDAGLQFRTPPARRAEWVARGQLFLWEADRPVCMAVAQGHAAGGVRVGFVYTPAEWRRRGYASACVAAVSQRMLDSGCTFCMLYTDLSNPTSNRIYQEVGYRPVADVRDYDFA